MTILCPRQQQARRERILCTAAHLFAQDRYVDSKVAADPSPVISCNYLSNLGNMYLGFAIRYTPRVLLEWFGLLKVTRQNPLEAAWTYQIPYVDQWKGMLTRACWRGIFPGLNAYHTASRLNRLVWRYYIRIFHRIQAVARGTADLATSVRADSAMGASCGTEFLAVKDAPAIAFRCDTPCQPVLRKRMMA